MTLWALFRLALVGFSRHRMRALLTALGIIIGVGAFITMVALGSGASAKVTQQIASMGSNMLVAFGGSSNAGGVRGGTGSSASLTDDDVDAIVRTVPTVRRGELGDVDLGHHARLSGRSQLGCGQRRLFHGAGHRGGKQGLRGGADRGRPALWRRGSGGAVRARAQPQLPGARGADA
jgi:hypothetical protein